MKGRRSSTSVRKMKKGACGCLSETVLQLALLSRCYKAKTTRAQHQFACAPFNFPIPQYIDFYFYISLSTVPPSRISLRAVERKQMKKMDCYYYQYTCVVPPVFFFHSDTHLLAHTICTVFSWIFCPSSSSFFPSLVLHSIELPLQSLIQVLGSSKFNLTLLEVLFLNLLTFSFMRCNIILNLSSIINIQFWNII